jgi:hypothetical protein
LGAANGFSKAAGVLQPAFLNPPEEFTFISDFLVALEKLIRIAASGFRKASCSSPAALENLFATPQRL